jgi:hypothetical protein
MFASCRCNTGYKCRQQAAGAIQAIDAGYRLQMQCLPAADAIQATDAGNRLQVQFRPQLQATDAI